FEGRDRFGPAAAWLAKGVDLAALGRAAADYVRLAIPVPSVTGQVIIGEVIRIDRFGNLVTNIDHKLFDRFAQGAGIEIIAGSQMIGRLVATYADASAGETCALFGSTDHLEIAVNAGDAA